MFKSKYNWRSLKKRYVGLDFFRIISIMAVCAFHTVKFLKVDYGPLQSIVQMGAVFMTAFFMLSGYSLFVNYSYNNVVELPNLKTFYLKRIIGIIPIYYVVSLIFIISRYFIYKSDHSILEEVLLAPAEMLGIQSNFHSVFNYSHNGSTWFISCVLMCYLVYPLLQEVTKQISNKAKIILIVVMMFVLFYSPFIPLQYKTVGLYTNPFFRILEFSIGVLLASMKPWLDEKIFINKFIYKWTFVILIDVFMIVLVTLAVHLGFFVGNSMIYSIICLPCFILMLIGLSGARQSDSLANSKVLRYCSAIGYVFFLAQLFSNKICKVIIAKLHITNNILLILLGWLVCIILAVALHEIFEKPITKFLKKKLLSK